MPLNSRSRQTSSGERVVHLALTRSGFDPVMQPRTQPRDLTEDPWVASAQVVAKTRPDNVAWRELDVYVVDAKYKLPREHAPPSRDDQYQMFAYSHLVRDDPRQVRAAVLVYPGSQNVRIWTRGRDDRTDAVRLFATHIPFPQPGQVKDPLSWMRYLDEVGARLARQLELFGGSPMVGIA